MSHRKTRTRLKLGVASRPLTIETVFDCCSVCRGYLRPGCVSSRADLTPIAFQSIERLHSLDGRMRLASLHAAPTVYLPIRRRLSLHPRLLLLNLMRKMYLVLRGVPFPPFPNECLNTLKLPKFVGGLKSGISSRGFFNLQMTVRSFVYFQPLRMTCAIRLR